jgi:hypothetical protein
LKYATLGLLFVNVSIGGTLTHFAAPPVLMVARPWGWDTAFMLQHIGWRATLAIAVSTVGGYLLFRREFATLVQRPAPLDQAAPTDEARRHGYGPLAIPRMDHGGLRAVPRVDRGQLALPGALPRRVLFFLGFDRATTAYSTLHRLQDARCWSASSWPAWSCTAACKAGGWGRC